MKTASEEEPDASQWPQQLLRPGEALSKRE